MASLNLIQEPGFISLGYSTFNSEGNPLGGEEDYLMDIGPGAYLRIDPSFLHNVFPNGKIPHPHYHQNDIDTFQVYRQLGELPRQTFLEGVLNNSSVITHSPSISAPTDEQLMDAVKTNYEDVKSYAEFCKMLDSVTDGRMYHGSRGTLRREPERLVATPLGRGVGSVYFARYPMLATSFTDHEGGNALFTVSQKTPSTKYIGYGGFKIMPEVDPSYVEEIFVDRTGLQALEEKGLLNRPYVDRERLVKELVVPLLEDGIFAAIVINEFARRLETGRRS